MRSDKHFSSAKSRKARRAIDLKSAVLRLLVKEPLDKVRIAQHLRLNDAEYRALKQLLKQLEQSGTIVRVRKQRYALPDTVDLVTGSIGFHKNGSAHVISDVSGVSDLYIPPEKTSTAMQGDHVVVRVMRPILIQGWRKGFRQEGEVIRILKRANKTIVGTLQKSQNFYYVVADDPRFVHNLYIKSLAPLKAKVGDKVVARLDAWTSRHVNPEGTLLEVLGRAGAPGVDLISILRRHRLPEDFPSEVLRQADQIDPNISLNEIERRLDLRQNLIITIDPNDAQDFDDAIEVQRTQNGWKVGIHIADVSHYVRSRSPLDREALLRGNSVYLPGRVIPMLPKTLSEGICSLRPREERLTFSIFAEVAKSGKIHSVHFSKSIICSAARLTYKEAYVILQRIPQTEIEHQVHIAWEVASVLRRRRFTQGALDLDFPEVKVWVDASGRPVRFERIENDISHQLIEELMLLANELTARELKTHKQPTLYRIHEKPDPERLLEYREQVLLHGLSVGDLSNRDEIQKLMKSLQGSPYEPILKVGLLKSLKRARYSVDPLGHFGLAKANYLHFTSPIRRYADLVSHRSLERHLGLARSGPSRLSTVAEHISTTERTATDAEREAIRLKKLEYFHQLLHKKTTTSFQAIIFEVRSYGLFIEIPELLFTGFIPLSSLGDDFFVYDLARQRLVGRRSKTIHKTGDTVDVAVLRVDFFKQQVDFKLL